VNLERDNKCGIGYNNYICTEVAVLYLKHFRSHPYEIMKWKFEEKILFINSLSKHN